MVIVRQDSNYSNVFVGVYWIFELFRTGSSWQ